MYANTRTSGTVTHLLDTIDLEKQEMLDIFETIRQLKAADMQGAVPQILKGASLAMIFEEPSTRTRVSFETAMTDLGGHALYLKPGEIHFGSHEAIKDTAKILSSMCHGIMFRSKEHECMLNLAEHATVPVFNAMTYYNHPTQGICDFFTMSEHLPRGKKLEDIHVVFIGDSREDTGIMSKETGHMCATLGLRYTVASPVRYSMSDLEQRKIRGKMELTGGTLRVTDDIDDAVKDADFIIPDVWTYYGYENEEADRMDAFMPKFQLNMELLNKAPTHCKALHCLPANRDVEITSEVMDHPTRSIVFQEAENRLHTQRGLLAWLLYPRLREANERLRQYTEGQLRQFLDTRCK
ncbi:ornithine carbamoyltransferase [Endozoicomonas elysicola]|uniref:Ornithine carbamoyltransferase n=1 Tax=Endozoicomonas elysicola TaxID=305900 RepID=A0A081K6Q7_9GAMM|nr:ornithine carbamoyltransferase [Endozoicomonas elysicola]KEI69833.1 putrescine carbamoyltransferase [Endozoicomonas elysicola]